MHTTAESQLIKLLSYNIQVGINSVRPHHYVTRGLRHILPSKDRFSNLDEIAQTVSGYDFVALQELDAGSYRTGFVDMTQYLATKAEYPHCYHQLNRNLGKVAQHGNGFLSAYKPQQILEHKLPGTVPGRGGLEVHLGNAEQPLVLIQLHLALGRHSRGQQLDYISELVNRYQYVIVMGDFNSEPQSKEMDKLFCETSLKMPQKDLKTFPSWRPEKHIDHILVTEGIEIIDCRVLSEVNSDHLPVAMDVLVPQQVIGTI